MCPIPDKVDTTTPTTVVLLVNEINRPRMFFRDFYDNYNDAGQCTRCEGANEYEARSIIYYIM